jgi:hypothetical protein
MKVAQLMKKLADFRPDQEVFFQYPRGDYANIQEAGLLESVETLSVILDPDGSKGLLQRTVPLGHFVDNIDDLEDDDRENAIDAVVLG